MKGVVVPTGGLSVVVDRRVGLLCCIIIVLHLLSVSVYPVHAASSASASEQPVVSSRSLRLSVNDALALFISQNLDVLIAKYGIEYSKGQQITAALFPNPVASIGTVSSFTQGRTSSNSGAVISQVQQLFELAGKRGYRIESEIGRAHV